MAGYVEDTIVALATPPGVGAIAIVRLSGREARTVAERVVRAPDDARVSAGDALRSSHHARLAIVVDPTTGEPVDRVLVLPMLAPRSFTGEDVVELHCHGGSMVADRVQRALLAAGARAARPGEFTERAFLNGKLDLCQAEAVADLIEASSTAGHRAAWRQLEGELSRHLGAIRDEVLDARALAEAHLDFPEDDLPPDAEREMARAIAGAGRSVEHLAATFERGRLAREGIRVALLGKPNVGKSSLLNALLGRERALVSAEPGTTRDYLEEPAAIGGLRVLLCDTAGLRETAGAVESAGIARSRERVDTADVVVAVLDASQPLDAEDEAVRAACRGKPLVEVRNKTDLPPAWPARAGQVDVSALHGRGLATLGEAILAALPAAGLEPPTESPLVTHVRHHVGLVRGGEALRRAALALDHGSGLELVAAELQAATVELDRLLGATDVEDVLDRVFSRFCVGK